MTSPLAGTREPTRSTRLIGWDANGRQLRIVLIAFLAISLVSVVGWSIKIAMTPEVLYSDFFGFWSFGRFVVTHAPPDIYDLPQLLAFEHALGLAQKNSYPFMYPPWILVLLAPIGQLWFIAALVSWVGLSYAAHLWAAIGRGWPRLLVLLLAFGPSSIVCAIPGQNGFLSAALLLGGLRLFGARPMVAGALLGAMAYKPQLALMVPVVLVSRGSARAMIGAALALGALTAASVLMFGTEIWATWVRSTLDQTSRLTSGYATLLIKMPTVTSAVQMVHGGPGLAHALQAVAALGAVAAVWCVRRRDDARARAVVVFATLLATPYAFNYDLPMLTGAVLAVIAARVAEAGRIGTGELLLLLACLELPILPWTGSAIGAVAPPVFAVMSWMYVRGPREAVGAAVPI